MLCLYTYQCDFLTPDIFPERINLRKTYLENGDMALKRFRLIVYRHLDDTETFELISPNVFNRRYAFHRINVNKLEF